MRNWKGRTGQVTLGPRTILAGPSMSGKSAIEDAIRVALTGYTSIGKTPAKTARFASGGSCEVSISDGTNTLSREFRISGAKITQTITLNGQPIEAKNLILPSSMTIPTEAIHPHEFLELSGDKRAEWFFGTLDPSSVMVDPDKIEAKIPWFKKPIKAAEFMDTLAAKLKSAEAEIDRCRANLQRLMGAPSALPAGTRAGWEETLAANEQSLEVTIREQAANLERANLTASRQGTIKRLEQQAEGLHRRIELAEKKIADLQKTILPASPGDTAGRLGKQKNLVDDLAAKMKALGNEIVLGKKSLEALAEGRCPTCGAAGAVVADLADELDLSIANKQLELEATSKAFSITNDELRRIEKVVLAEESNQQVQREIALERDAITRYKSQVEETARSITETQDARDAAPLDPTILQAKIDGCRMAIEQAKTNIQTFVEAGSAKQLLADAESDRMKLAGEIEDLKSAREAAKKIRDEALGDVAARIQQPFDVAVRQAFAAKAYFRVVDPKGKPSVDFGIIRQGREISYETMCGGERPAILAALAVAIQAAKSPGGAKLALLEVAEADKGIILGLCQACDVLGIEQVIMASCHIDHSPNDKWQLVHVNRAWAAADEVKF